MQDFHDYYVYIISCKSRSTLYIGVTNSLKDRLWQHRHPVSDSFAARYHLQYLLYFECFRDVNDAIAREKQLKGWRREKKVVLINRMNPRWDDLAADWFE